MKTKKIRREIKRYGEKRLRAGFIVKIYLYLACGHSDWFKYDDVYANSAPCNECVEEKEPDEKQIRV